MAKKFTMERNITFNSDLNTALEVLLDTEKYPTYIESIQSANLVSKNGENSEVSYKAKIAVFPLSNRIAYHALSAGILLLRWSLALFC